MKHKDFIMKACALWVFLFTGIINLKANNNNSFAVPDFAFPKEVSKNAKAELDHSLKNGDGVTALRAAMQVVIADNLVSRENLSSGVALFDSLSYQLSSPYSGVACLLEARLLADAYRSDQWTYNNRVLPLTPYPEDIKAWSRDQFAARVGELVNRGMSVTDKARELSIKAVAPLVSDIKDAEKAGFTLYDFMAIQSNELSRPFSSREEVIPFGNTSSANGSGKSYKYLDEAIDWNLEMGKFQPAALLSELKLGSLSGNERKTWNDKCLERFANFPWAAPFILTKAGENSEEKNVAANYTYVKTYLDRFPDCYQHEQLEAYLINLKVQTVTLSGNDQYLPGSKISGKAEISNLDSFYILAVKFPDSYIDKNVKKDAVVSASTVSASTEITLEKPSGDLPYFVEKEFTLESLEPGVYAFVASTTADKTGLLWHNSANSTIPTFLVSNLSTIQCSDRQNKTGNALYVVNGGIQQPVKGATVKFTPSYKWKDAKAVTAVSDANGMVAIPTGSYNIKITSGKNILAVSAYGYSSAEEWQTTLRGNVFTDLSIYHPGDSVKFSVVAYTSKQQNLQAAPNRKIKLRLLDANWELKETLELTTDRFGRVSGKLKMPQNGLLGLWRLQVTDEKDNWCGETAVQVSEYKSPTFYVETTGGEGSFNAGDEIKITGLVKTYSGMPVGGARIKYNVSYNPVWWWRSSEGPASYGGETFANTDGSFTIDLPTASLKDTRFAFGRYNLEIEATDAAGETQAAQPLLFALGDACEIRPSIPEYVDADNYQGKPTVAVYDIAGFPAIKKVYYRIEKGKDQEVIKQGEFESPAFPVDLTKLSSGEYTILLSLDPTFQEDKDMGSVKKCKVIVYRKSDKTPPVATSLWLPESKILVPAGADNVDIRVGSSYPDSYILAVIADMNGVKERRWVKVNDGIITLSVKAPSKTSRVEVTFAGMHNLDGKVKSVELIPEIQTKKLEIKTESFRDRTSPGIKENWQFRFTLDGKKMADLPVMAVMSNKALNALQPFRWNFDPASSLSWYFGNIMNQNHIGRYYWGMTLSKYANKAGNSFVWPAWDTYGYSLYGGGYSMSNMRVRGAAMKKEANFAQDMEADEVAEEVLATVAPTSIKLESVTDEVFAGAEGDGNSGETKEEPLREVECASAFFMPELTTDSEGLATVECTMPDFNGTWQFQILGYTPEMKGNVEVLDVIAAKSVMVAMNAPRFVRSGDKVEISGRIFNNSPETAALGGKFVIYNPLSGEPLKTEEFANEEVSPMGYRTVNISFDIPGQTEMLGIRLYGMNQLHNDGEQTIIPVYPSSTPVIESETFYLAPGEKEITIPIPKTDNGTLTLNYTDNPIWECVSALPAISNPDSKNAIALSSALYANKIASGLLGKYPELEHALKMMSDPENASDSLLISNLEKNPSLKTVALDNTPWVRDAKCQNMRMARLSEFLDKKNIEKVDKELVASLKQLQNSDGGWSWCDGMESSEFITRYVLEELAMLARAGFLSPEGELMAQKGLGYMDNYYVKEWERIGSKKFSYLSVMDYLYIRNSFQNRKTTSKFQTIINNSLQAISTEWKKMGIFGKATAASILWKANRQSATSEILRSLQEYSSYSKKQGMWFDNLTNSWFTPSKIETTSRVLTTFAEIDPKSESVDKMRQWVLLSLQTGDPEAGTGEMTEMINAILSTGSKWTNTASKPTIFIDGSELEVDKLTQLTGSLVTSVSGKKGDIRIVRDAEGPAWGGIISQYVAPIEDVKAAKVDRLSLEKNIYKVSVDEKGTYAESGNFQIGDKVKVTLTLKCDRDLRYIAVTDSRAACLEPADQISGYTVHDGIWMYEEVRNSATNLFIPFLPKGTHVISYVCFVDRPGVYSLGIATAQSQYSPVITAHSAGEELRVSQGE